MNVHCKLIQLRFTAVVELSVVEVDRVHNDMCVIQGITLVFLMDRR